MMDAYLNNLATESVNEQTRHIDVLSTQEMVALINAQDALVALAVQKENAHIAQAVDLIVAGLERGGRLIYLGAGTSGRLGVLDASECPPTFGVDAGMVQGFIAGGDTALRSAVEGAEDDEAAGETLVDRLKAGENDVICGITASGSAPYVLAAMRRAGARGAKTIGLCTNAGSKLEKVCDVTIAPVVGAEVISGSTRMKSGTAQKMVLNMLSTCAMIRLGKVYGNLMVDLRASNKKLVNRAKRLIMHATDADEAQAARVLEQAEGHVKLAILIRESGLPAQDARALLEAHGGRLRAAIEDAKGENG